MRQIVVDIPDTAWELLKDGQVRNGGITSNCFLNAVKVGTPLENILSDIKAVITQGAQAYDRGGRGNGKSIRYGMMRAVQLIDEYAKGKVRPVYEVRNMTMEMLETECTNPNE